MDGKKIDTRILHKHDTEANWDQNASSFVPKAGELIIYDVDSENPAPRFKVGNGLDEIDNLPFVTGTYGNNILMSQDNNNTIADAIAAAGKVETVANVGVATGTKNVPLTGADIPMSASDSTVKIATAITSSIHDAIEVTLPNVSDSNRTFYAPGITSQHELIQDGFAYIETPSAVNSNLTIETGLNLISIAGTLSGTTNIKATFCIKGTKVSATAYQD